MCYTKRVGLHLLRRYSNDCPTSNLQSLLDSPDFYQDNYVLPIINAVYSFIAAAHDTLKVQCGENYDGVCTKFYTDPNTNKILYSKITNVGFQDDSGSTFQFIGKEGNTGREITLYDGSQMTTVSKLLYALQTKMLDIL